jgi:RHS repeat-associated protein
LGRDLLRRSGVDRGVALHQFTYDALGRLLKDVDPSGYEQTLTRTESAAGYAVALTSKLGRTRTHDVQRTAEGNTQIAVTAPDGTVTTTVRSGSTVTTTSATTSSKATYTADARFRMQAPTATIEVQQLNGGPKTVIANTREVTLADANDPLSVSKLVQRSVVNGRSAARTWDAATSTWTADSATHLTSKWKLDTLGHVVSVQQGNLLPTTLAYDEHGRLTQTTTGDRTSSWSFDATGHVSAAVDALQQKTSFAYDAGGRVTSLTYGDDAALALGYDANDHLTGITPPGASVHAFSYAPGDLLSAYVPPAAGDTGSGTSQYAYNGDKQLLSTTDPGGRAIASSFDATSGRLTAVTMPEASFAFTYDAAGRLASATRGDQGLAFSYQGSLLTREASTGAISGEVSRTWDANLWLSEESVNGASIALQHDNDGRLTRIGEERLSYDRNGLHSEVSVGRVTARWSVNDHGEVVKTSATAGSTALFDTVTVRDKLGRVASRTETTLGEVHKLEYRYDVRGRLIEVLRDGVSTTYSYDKNGNRTGAAGIAASYDAQDRLLTLGTLSYAYTPSGQLAKKTDGAAVTAYSYDALGNLLSVSLPDGTAISYVIDAQGRRIGKKVNGALVKRWLYRNGLQPVAEVDSSGAMVARYVYGSRPNVPDHIIQGGATYQIIADELGSPRLVVNAADDTVAQRIDYDAWGNVLADSAPGFQPFGFAGGLYDTDTKLVRFGARDYDAQSGRWTAKDPIGFDGGQTNLSVYAGHDPVNYIDPQGRWGFAIGVSGNAGFGPLIGVGAESGTGVFWDISGGKLSWYTSTGWGTELASGLSIGAGWQGSLVWDSAGFWQTGTEVALNYTTYSVALGNSTSGSDKFGTPVSASFGRGASIGVDAHFFETLTKERATWDYASAFRALWQKLWPKTCSQ